MLLDVVNNCIPKQKESHALKKILLYYWEVVEKTNKDDNELK